MSKPSATPEPSTTPGTPLTANPMQAAKGQGIVSK
jgi:hypothetical protein